MREWVRSRKGIVLAMQWLLVGVVAVWGGTTGAWRTAPVVFWSLGGLFTLGNLGLMRLPAPYFYQPTHWMHLFVADTVFVGAAIYCMRGFDSELYLPYFMIILTAALTRSLTRGVLIAALVSVIYVVLMWQEGDRGKLLDPDVLIRLPFFFVIAIFTGYLAQSARLQQEAQDASGRLTDQVRSLQQLAAGIAHEVRNPLTAISNNLQLIIHRLPEGGPERGIAGDALDQVARVTRIVQETLELARPATLSARWLDVNPLVEHAAATVTAGGNGVAVTRRLTPRPLTVWGDPLLLEQAVTNILQNAREATPAGGSIELVTAAGASEGRDRVTVRVTDTGPGVPPHQLARLFQPFYTTKASGTGLGLCLARKFARAHGGDLTVQSPVAGARGTTVVITLPVAAPDQPLPVPPEAGGHAEAPADH